MFENMTLEELKERLENKSSLKFKIVTLFGRDEIIVDGLKTYENIAVKFLRYSTSDERNGKRFISIGYRSHESGGGRPCDSIDKAIKDIESIYLEMGYELPKEKFEQLSLFEWE